MNFKIQNNKIVKTEESTNNKAYRQHENLENSLNELSDLIDDIDDLKHIVRTLVGANEIKNKLSNINQSVKKINDWLNELI